MTKPPDSALRSAYQALLDRARRAEAERDVLHTENERLKLTTDWADIDALRAENETLRAQVMETARECGIQKSENERLRPAAQAVVACPLLDNACEHIRALAVALGIPNLG